MDYQNTDIILHYDEQEHSSYSIMQSFTAANNIDSQMDYYSEQPYFYLSQTTESFTSGPNSLVDFNHIQNNSQPSLHTDGVSLSEASVCSSLIHTPDVHPVPDMTIATTNATDSSSEIVAQTIASTSYPPSSSASVIQLNSDLYQQQNAFVIDPVVTWPNTNNRTTSVSEASILNLSNDTELSVINSRKLAVDIQGNFLVKTQDDKDTQVSSTNKILTGKCRNTVSLPYYDKFWNPVPVTEKEWRKKSTNNSSLKKEATATQSDKYGFFHLSREELIQRVVELEREKQLSVNKPTGDGPQIASLGLDFQVDGSDEEETHVCRWAGCSFTSLTLDHLTVHIKELHIGSGKATYYCEWTSCPRGNKPFMKRHKMQNHMRTHTGEKPFKCNVEGCDKRFSRLDSLNTHIKTHSNIRPYTCPIKNCSKAYFHSRSLRKHVKSHEASKEPNVGSLTRKENHNALDQDMMVHQMTDQQSFKPIRYCYDYQKQSCGSEDRQLLTIETKHTPIIHYTELHEQGQYLVSPSSIVDQSRFIEQQELFAAGTAYTMDASNEPKQEEFLLYQPPYISYLLPSYQHIQQEPSQQNSSLLQQQQQCQGSNCIY
ncbi:MAG: hypothetical protein EXX96DRAFT_499375 [Benjaminiella poitrasii]|nr:MAG: hypothetical protein EXX96DRAFT_499375 [Benjaminiella poitrasii]